jgi:hypothetical protein
MKVMGNDGRDYVDQADVFQQWLSGAISGANLMASLYGVGIKQALVDVASVDLFVRNYCSSHPTSAIVEALWALLRQEGTAPPLPPQ